MAGSCGNSFFAAIFLVWQKVSAMTLAAWFSLATICILGAMSPGPSLAVVLKNTLAGGRTEGIKTALAHGFGVGLYAFATVAGLAVLIIGSPLAFMIIQWLGALFLAYLGIKALFGSTGLSDAAQINTYSTYTGNGLRSGFLIAFLNPKLAIFFAALFSQYVSSQAQFPEKIFMALTAGFIDTGWYLIVVLALSHSSVLDALRNRAALLDKLFGFLLVLLAGRIVLFASA